MPQTRDERQAKALRPHVLAPLIGPCLAAASLGVRRSSGREVTVVIRTFGTDLPMIAEAITAFADGERAPQPSLAALACAVGGCPRAR